MTVRYRLDPAQSRFTVQSFAAGMLSFLGHNPTFAVSGFVGEMKFDLASPGEGASVRLTVRADSLQLMDKVSPSDRRQIEDTMRKETLEVAAFPEIAFESTEVAVGPRTGDEMPHADYGPDDAARGRTAPTDRRSAYPVLRRRSFGWRVRVASVRVPPAAGGCARGHNQVKGCVKGVFRSRCVERGRKRIRAEQTHERTSKGERARPCLALRARVKRPMSYSAASRRRWTRPGMEIFEASAKTGDGMDRWLDWLLSRRNAARAAAVPSSIEPSKGKS